MLLYPALIVSALIGWYTINVARVEWANGNRFGAVVIAALAAVSAGVAMVTVIGRPTGG